MPKDPLPEEFETLEDLAEFWDTHDVADYAEYLTPVECEVVAHPTHEYVIYSMTASRRDGLPPFPPA
jgi:hypothetical protein